MKYYKTIPASASQHPPPDTNSDQHHHDFLPNWPLGKLAAVFMVAFAAIAAYSSHAQWANGPSYWKWDYFDLGFTRMAPPLLAGLIPALLGHHLFSRGRMGVAPALFFTCLSMLLIEFARFGIMSNWAIRPGIVELVSDPIITSYFGDAAKHAHNKGLLVHYHKLLSQMQLHTQTKPPGPLLFYILFINIFSNGTIDASALEAAAFYGGLTIMLIAPLGALGCYWLARKSGCSPEGALSVATLYAISTGPLSFAPAFDQVYTAISTAMAALWLVALKKRSCRLAIATGLIVSLAAFFSYTLLVIGFFMFMAVLLEYYEHPVRATLNDLALICCIAAVVIAAVFGILWIVTGYDPFRSFHQSLELQKILLAQYPRPYPDTILFDHTDFFMGMNWVALPLFFFAIYRCARLWSDATSRHALLGAAQVVVVGFTGLIAGETARVWIFLMPFMLISVATELEKWPYWTRIWIFSISALVLVATVSNMAFF